MKKDKFAELGFDSRNMVIREIQLTFFLTMQYSV